MIARILFVLGPVVLVLAAVRSSTGLLVTGALWSGMAFALEWHRRRLRAALASPRKDGPPVSVGVALAGAALLLVTGVPPLLIGLLDLGVDDGWRWLPLFGGGALTALGLVSAFLYLLGAGAMAAMGPAPTVPADLVIVSMSQTGTIVNHQPRLEFVFDVRPDDRDPYRVTKRATVPLTALGSLEVGRGFRALVVGPDDPENMAIDWDTPLPRP